MDVDKMTQIHQPHTLYVYVVQDMDCPHCASVKDTLGMLGLPFNVMTLSRDGAKSLGVDTVPQVFYGKTPIGGRVQTEQYLNEMGMLPLFRPLRSGLTPPTRGSEEAAGMDLYADFDPEELAKKQGLIFKKNEGRRYVKIRPGQRAAIPTGWAVMVPKGTYGRIAPRGGLAWKEGVMEMAGVIDRDYRGEMNVILYNSGKEDLVVENGQRVAQLVLEKVCMSERGAVVHELPDTKRGEGRYGSTGR